MHKICGLFLTLILSACMFGTHRIPVSLLDNAFSNTGADVIHQTWNNSYRLTFPSTATFKDQSAVLSPQLMLMLDKLVSIVKKYPNTHVVVHGYSDQKGKKQLNHALSERRAHAAISYMESQGLSPARFVTHSHGETCPRYFGKKAYMNKRIEISIHYKAGDFGDNCQ